MTDDMQPRNELEKQLLAAQEDRISSDDLLKILMDSQVFMPVQDEKAQPLVLVAEDETPVLVLFSSPERAKPFIKDFPGFEGGILEPFTWVLENMGSGYGIALNPGSELGVDMEPETVADLAGSLTATPKH